MKEKGFTLIELLAVIVILAIIALIAVPIVLNIINESRESANQRSIENYGKAIGNAIMKSEMKNNKVTPGDLSQAFLKTVEYEGNTVSCTTAKLYESGKIYLAGCTVNGKGNYSYGTEESESSTSICTLDTDLDSNGQISAGDKYACNFMSNAYFYVLGENEEDNTKVDLIMDRNYIEGDTVPYRMPFGTSNETLEGLQSYIEHIQDVFGNAVTVSIPSAEQLSDSLDIDNFATENSLPNWMCGVNLITEFGKPNGYWTSTPAAGAVSAGPTDRIYVVGYGCNINATRYDTVSNIGIRPVVTVPKTALSSN